MLSAHRLWSALSVAAALAYPFLVYFTMSHVSTRLLLLPVLALLALRLFGTDNLAGPGLTAAVLLAALGLLALSVRWPSTAIRAYPVMMSLLAASAFGLSLWRGPSLIERVVRRTQPALPPQGVRYTWWVTLVWCAFLTINAVIAGVAAVWGTLEQWTLWNGLLFYVAAGVLMGGERLVRTRFAP